MKKPSAEGGRLFLIDGTALAYRSYFAFIRNPLVNSKSMNTSGIFGFTAALMRLLREEKPDFIACMFDTKAPTFRHRAYKEYKATRQKMPEEMAEQLPRIREVVEAFRIPIFEVEGYEADDVMGTLARKAEAAGLDTWMVTSDKDLMQLLSERIHMYSLGKPAGESESMGPEGAVKKLGVPPEKVIDLLSLMGDSSDNIPGVPGIGPKTALELIEQFDTLEAVLAGLDRIERKSVREKLEKNREMALLSKELVTIHTDAPVSLDTGRLKRQNPDNARIIALFQELEFTRLLQELPGLAEDRKPRVKRDYRTIHTAGELENLIRTLKKSRGFSVDLETTSIEPMHAKIVGLSFSWEPGCAAYVPVQGMGAPRSGDLFSPGSDAAVSPVLKRLKPLLEDESLLKCGQNIKYDMLVLKNAGINLAPVDFDTMVAAYLINPTARQFNLDALALEYLEEKKIPTESLIGSGARQITMDQVPLEKISEYACEDADVAFRLRRVLEPKLAESGTEVLFRDVELPLIRVLMEMEENGVALDVRLLESMSRDMEGQLQAIREDVYSLAGESFNINSTQQLGRILYEKLKVHESLGLKRPKKTKTGYATDVRVLEGLAAHPLPKKLLEYRQLAKLKSTYVDALPKLVHPETGLVHASFNQTVTATGRLSSSNPNLQNIPVRTELGKEIRKAFVSRHKGGVILSADYNQIELRIMAHLSGDETLMESFRKGEDVHRRTAAELFGIPAGSVTDEHRRQAKTINFGILYGMGAFGLSDRLGIPLEQANGFIKAYFARYPKVNEYILKTIAAAHQDGYVTTLLNRRRYLPELASDNRGLREFGERTAINTPIQGTAADLIKVAMIRIADRMRAEGKQERMILQIHDELVFDVPSKRDAESFGKMVEREMEGAIKLNVPVRVDVGIGENWFEAH